MDADPTPARFIPTGSATSTNTPTHSGAGRIVTVRMHPMSLAESDIETPSVSLLDLLSGDRPELSGSSSIDLERYADKTVRSGFPAIRELPGRLLRSQLDGYLDRIVEREFAEADHNVRNKGALRRWMTAYAAASSTTASFETIRDAASPGEINKPAKSTTVPYRATLEQLRMIDEVTAWTPSRNRLRRLAMSPVCTSSRPSPRCTAPGGRHRSSHQR